MVEGSWTADRNKIGMRLPFEEQLYNRIYLDMGVLMTIGGAQEPAYTFIIYLLDGHWPGKKRLSGSDLCAEEATLRTVAQFFQLLYSS